MLCFLILIFFSIYYYSFFFNRRIKGPSGIAHTPYFGISNIFFLCLFKVLKFFTIHSFHVQTSSFIHKALLIYHSIVSALLQEQLHLLGLDDPLIPLSTSAYHPASSRAPLGPPCSCRGRFQPSFLPSGCTVPTGSSNVEFGVHGDVQSWS